MSAQAVLRSIHLSTVPTVVAGCATVVLVLKVPLVVPHMLHCCSTLETLDPSFNVNHGVACSGAKFTLKKGMKPLKNTCALIRVGLIMRLPIKSLGVGKNLLHNSKHFFWCFEKSQDF